MSETPLRLAVAGLGRMGTFHLDMLDGIAEIAVVALIDPDHSARDRAAARYPDAALHDTLDRLPAHVDALLVASSTPSHGRLVEAALHDGLHVLCEKPLTLDPAESMLLGGRFAAAGLVLQVGFWRRFAPPWVEARRAVKAGHIGEPRLLRLSQWDANPPPPEFCDPAVSGGLAVDCGVHEFDLAEWLSGSTVTRVSAWAPPTVDEGLARVGDVDNLVVVAELATRAVATIDLSRNARYGDDVRTEVLGSEGAVFVDLLPTGRTRLATASGVEVLPASVTADAMAAGVTAQAVAFARRAAGGEVDVPGAAASARATAAALVAARAAREGGTCELPAIDGT